MKKFLSVILSILMLGSICIGYAGAIESADLAEFSGGLYFVRKDNTVYYPYEVSFSNNYKDMCYRISSLSDGSTKISFRLEYNHNDLKLEAVLISKELKNVNGAVSVKAQGNVDDTFSYADIEITVNGFNSLQNDMIVMNVKYTVLKEDFVSSAGTANLLSYISSGNWTISGADSTSYDFGTKANFFPFFVTDGLTYNDLLIKYKDYNPYDPANVVEAESVSLNNHSITLKYKGTAKLNATVAPSNADNQTVIWSSSDPSVATVDANGNVKSVGCGTTIITASVYGTQLTDTCTVQIHYTFWQFILHIISIIFHIK
jgi:hypothetical protein